MVANSGLLRVQLIQIAKRTAFIRAADSAERFVRQPAMNTAATLIKPRRQVFTPVFSIQRHAKMLLADAVMDNADICIIMSRLHQSQWQVVG